MNVKVFVFAHLREMVGSGSIELELAEGATGEEVLRILETAYPKIKDHRQYLKLSMNGEYIDPETAIEQDAEIAVFPPVSGG